MRAVLQPIEATDETQINDTDMGFFSGLSLSNITSQISLNNVVGALTGNTGTGSPTSTASTATHTVAGSIVAGVANAVTGGAFGNGTNQISGAYQIGQFVGNVGNSVLAQNMPSVVDAVQNAVDSQPALGQAIDTLTNVAIDTAQKTMWQRASDWVKENKTIVFLVSLIPIYFIVKPLMFGKSRTKRSYKR